MQMLSASTIITAPEPETEPVEEPCYVQQQQDAADTVPCSGNQGLLNELLGLMGFDIPAPEQPETYSTQIKVKPKNAYTNLNISFSENVESAEKWDQSDDEQQISISSSDFVESESGGYVDLAGKLNLTETDKIKSAYWIGTVYDADLSPLTVEPSTNVDADNHLPLSQPVNGELLVTVSETYQLFDLKVAPRDDGGENAYQSSLIVQPEGCEGQPTRYEINVPDCYRNSWLDKYGWPGDDSTGDVTIYDPPPEFVDQVDAEDQYCLCGNHKLLGRYPKSREEADISNICHGGPCDKITEPDCVPDDREDGDEYC